MLESVRAWIAAPLAQEIAKLVVAVAVVAALVRLVRAAAARSIHDTDLRYRVRKVTSFAGYGASALVVLVTLGGHLGSVTLVIGAASVGVGFALQEVVVSVAGWLAISFGGLYKTGDRVQLGGILGDVIDIGVLRTTMLECGAWVKGDQYNGRIVRVANSFVFKAPVFSYSADFPFLWDEITVPIKYGSDHRLARTLLERISADVAGGFAADAKAAWAGLVLRYRSEDARLEPMVMVIANDNWIEFTVRYVVDYRMRRTTKDQLFSRILDAVDESKGKVALASATFQLVEAPPISIRLERPARVPSPAPPAREGQVGSDSV